MEKAVLFIMALLGPVLGNGQINGNCGIWRPTSIIDDASIEPGFSIAVGFYSPSGEFVGNLQTSQDGAGFINFEIIENRIGGLDSFEFEIARRVDIPFYPLLECRFFISGQKWYTGELIYQPTQDKRETTYTYEGNGYAEYMKRIKVNTTYSNKTLEYIIDDLIRNQVVSKSRIIYNPELIEPPNISITKFEIKNKDIWKTMERLLEIANYDYNTNQYTFGVDKNRHFYFKEVSQEVDMGFFEGFQYQNPDTKENFKKVINQINIYRTQENSQDVELVTSVNDLDSQAKYGLKAKNLTIPVFLDTNSAINIANSILERNKEPFSTVNVKNLEAETEPFPIQFYQLNNKVNDYNKIIAEFELLSEWSYNITNTTIVTTENKVLSGRKAFKCDLNNSNGEYIEQEYEEEINFPEYLDIWLAQMTAGKYIKIWIWDVNNRLQTEELEVLIINDFNRIRINVNLNNIKKIRVEFISDVVNTIYLDRLQVATQSYFRHQLILDKIKYKLDRSKLLADATFGEKIDTILDGIKKIKKENENIFDIFEKG
jgi:hypothetical protein